MTHNLLLLYRRLLKLWSQLRWHWFDVVVLVAIIAVFGGLLWARLQRRTEWISIQLKVSPDEWWWKSESPEYWYADTLLPGTKSINSFGEEVAELEEVQAIDMGDGRKQVIAQIKLKVTRDAQKNQYVYAFQPLQVGRGLELSFASQQIRGLVMRVNQPQPEKVTRLIAIRIASVDPAVVASFPQGLKSYDRSGQVLAEIVEIKSTTAMQAYFSDIRAQMVTVPNPHYLDVDAVVKVTLTKEQDEYYFAQFFPIKVGSYLTIQFPQAIFSGQIRGWADQK